MTLVAPTNALDTVKIIENIEADINTTLTWEMDHPVINMYKNAGLDEQQALAELSKLKEVAAEWVMKLKAHYKDLTGVDYGA